MRVLAIDNVESDNVALHLASKERKVHLHCSYEISLNLKFDFIDK